jgi:uncharacterized membrane protein
MNKYLTPDRETKINLPLVIFSLVYYGLVIFLAAYINIWEDELYSLNTTSGTLKYAFHQSVHFEVQPPVYFLLLTLWRVISHSVIWARLFSVVIILLSQLLFYRFTSQLTNRKVATAGTILFLLNPVTIFAVLEIRTFSLVILFSVAILLAFYNSYFKNNLTAGKRLFFILLAISGLFTQYFVGFLLFANAVALLPGRKWRTFLIYVLDMVIPLCLVILFVSNIFQHIDVSTAAVPEYQRSTGDLIAEIKEILIRRPFSYILPFNFILPRFWYWIFKAAIIVSIIISVNYTEIKKRLSDLFPYIIISLIIIVFFILVDYIFGKYSTEYKYTILLFVPLFIAFLFLFRIIRQNLLVVWTIAIAIIYISENVRFYQGVYKVNDFRALAKYLEANQKDGEPVFVFRNISAENLTIYYKGINDVIPVPKPFSYDSDFSPEQWNITPADIDNLSDKMLTHNNFYIIFDNSALRGAGESKKILMDFLTGRFSMVEDKHFRGLIELCKFANNKESVPAR